MALVLRYAARSDVGLVRPANEDSGYAGSRMLVVADGMGGHAAGELASATAVAIFADLDVQDELRPGDDEILGVLAGAIDEAQETLGEIAAQYPEARGMGTTITALAWLNTRVALAHIGDSRAYRLRDGVLTQLTHDHTYVQTLVDSGQITADQAAVHARRNLLTRALDGVHEVDSDLSIVPVRAGDRFLLCSDGLHGVVSDADIAALLASPSDPTGVVGALVDRALAGGAPDNVTALVADVLEVPDTGELVERSPIVVGAASERENRERLPSVQFPDDAEPTATAPLAATVTANPTSPVDTPPAGASAPAGGAGATAATAGAGGAAAGGAQGHKRTPWWAVITAAALIAALLGAWSWTRSQYYVGDYEGSVAVFQGIPQGFGPNGFSTVEQVSPVQVAALPEFEREKLEARIPADSPQDALRIVAALAAAAERCAATPPPAGCPTPTPGTATPSPSASPSATLSPTPGASTPAATPAPAPAGAAPAPAAAIAGGR